MRPYYYLGIVGPEGRVLAFEPNAELFPCLTENVSINGFAGRAEDLSEGRRRSAGVGSLKVDYSTMGAGYIDTSHSGRDGDWVSYT